MSTTRTRRFGCLAVTCLLLVASRAAVLGDDEPAAPDAVLSDSTVSKSDTGDAAATETAAAALPESEPVSVLEWHTDYTQAMDCAKADHKMMLIYFHDEAQQASREVIKEFENKALADAEIRKRLSRYILTKLPTDAQVTVDGENTAVLKHAAFDGMKAGPGLAIIDLVDDSAENYGYVVSVFPFQRGKYYEFKNEHLPVILDLPSGTLTQRTMIFAVRTHPEAPASTKGQQDPYLVSEAKSHSGYQASIRLQGHHFWDARSQRIASRLMGRGRTSSYPVEVCAESWPNQDLVDSCVDCVASWRQSDGHWSAVKAFHASYGYDIRRGSNGIWYATGIFAN